ncbi:hypothetical protein POVCU1_047940 [Plasmodium ovale curtisi]|uniref:Uncharacterized protein n=1 Tax=Plasmodium ovale curtisi TaxID=864141 RepID=A0A1A8X4I6_PLAOA|nr:hypothetical protein POVCU1_047940 [Plasmodium ovale curtisi]
MYIALQGNSSYSYQASTVIVICCANDCPIRPCHGYYHCNGHYHMASFTSRCCDFQHLLGHIDMQSFTKSNSEETSSSGIGIDMCTFPLKGWKGVHSNVRHRHGLGKRVTPRGSNNHNGHVQNYFYKNNFLQRDVTGEWVRIEDSYYASHHAQFDVVDIFRMICQHHAPNMFSSLLFPPHQIYCNSQNFRTLKRWEKKLSLVMYCTYPTPTLRDMEGILILDVSNMANVLNLLENAHLF